MIHQVKASPRNVELLNQIVVLQLVLLEMAAEEKDLTPSINSVPGNVELTLRAFYGDNKQARLVSDWITRRNRGNEYNDLFSALRKFAAHRNAVAKKEFVKGVRQDVELLNTPRKARLSVTIGAKSPAWKRSAGTFFKEFYEAFGSEKGLPEHLFRPSLPTQGFGRWDFIDEFSETNPDLRLCPVCDSTLYRTTIGGRPYASIEHFFPKSRYPHLSVHPLNLVPICPFCNSGAAGAIDPFGEDNLGALGLILPYQEYRGLSEQTYLYVRPQDRRDGHPLELVMLPNSDYPDAKTLIANFERTYKVQKRWNEDMDLLDQHVYRRVTQFLLGDVQSGNKLKDVNFLVDRLKVLMALISKENLGHDPFGFATIWLIKYQVDSLESDLEDPEDVPIYSSLCDWALTQQARWDSYREHAKVLIERVPQDTQAH